MTNKNPDYFTQCSQCNRYDVSIPQDKAIVERIRGGIIRSISDMGEDNPELEKAVENYKKCEECIVNRIKDVEFLSSIGIKPNII